MEHGYYSIIYDAFYIHRLKQLRFKCGLVVRKNDDIFIRHDVCTIFDEKISMITKVMMIRNRLFSLNLSCENFFLFEYCD